MQIAKEVSEHQRKIMEFVCIDCKIIFCSKCLSNHKSLNFEAWNSFNKQVWNKCRDHLDYTGKIEQLMQRAIKK